MLLVCEPETDATGAVTALTGLLVDVTAGRAPAPAHEQLRHLETEVEQLRSAMASRAAIEQAKGILMLLMSCGDQVAFDLLAHISSHTHRKVRDVARLDHRVGARSQLAARRRPRDPARRLPAGARGRLTARPTRRAPARSSAAPIGEDAGTVRGRRGPGTREGSRRVFYLFARFVLRPLVWVVFRPAVTGRENVPLTGPVILASNHLSFIDSIAIPLMAPRKVAYLAKAEYFRGSGFTGWVSRTLFTALGALPVEREASRAAQAALDTAMGVLRAGGAFGIYPEGTRSRDGRLARGKTGVAWLALNADCPVVPVAVRGTDGSSRSGRAGRDRTGCT